MKRNISRLVAVLALMALICTGLLPGHAIMASDTEPGTSVYEVAADSGAPVSVYKVAADSRALASVEINGTTYQKDDFAPMGSLVIGAKLESGGVTYDLLDAGTDTSTIGLFRTFTLDMSVRFTNNHLGSDNERYSWRMPSISLAEPLTGEIKNVDGTIYGHYMVDTDGTVYAVLSEAGMEQSVLEWNFRFDANWVVSSEHVNVDLGNGKYIRIDLDTRRLDVDKNGRFSSPGRYTFTVNLYALDDLELTSVDDIVTVLGWFKGLQAWCALEQIDIADACYLRNVCLTYTGADGIEHVLNIDEDHILIDRSIPPASDGCPNIKYHLDLGEPVALQMDEEAVLTYEFDLDPEAVRYLDLIDTLHYWFNNEVRVYLDDGTYASDETRVQGSERDLISKSYDWDGTADTAEWTISVSTNGPYSVAGMLVTDELKPGLTYLPQSGFTVSYGGTVLNPEVRECESQEELDSASGANVVYMYGNFFKYLIPDGPGTDDSVNISYWTTFSQEVMDKYGSRRLNVAYIVDPRYGESDSSSDVYKDGEILKYNNGVHVDADGLLYTDWSIEVSIPAGYECERFHFEDYVPSTKSNTLWDTLHLPADTFDEEGELTVYTSTSGHNTGYDPAQKLSDLGIGLSIVTESGADVTWDWLYRVRLREIRQAHDGSHYFTFWLCDRKNYNDRSNGLSSYWDGLSVKDEGYTVTLTIPMYLNGDAESLRRHTNRVVWYYNDDWASMGGNSSLNLYYMNNDEYLSNRVVSSRMSDDGTKAVLTYRARYNMYDRIGKNGWEAGTGYTFGPDLKEVKYASYVPGSAKVYWTETINDEPGWVYSKTGSPYDGETDLLKIQEDVPHKNGPDGPLATLVSESGSGFRVSIPYYGRTSGFYWRDADGQGRFYSPLFEYEVEVDLAAMEADKDYRYCVEDTFKAFLTDGTLDAVADAAYDVNVGALDKELTQRPNKENGYVARYEVIVDNTSENIRDLVPLDVIDVMDSPSMRFLPGEMTAEYSRDGETWEKLDAGKYRTMYDVDAHMLTFRIDNTEPENYYRIGYAVKFTGNPGDKLSVSNSAWLAGFREQDANVKETVTIDQVTSSASGAKASIEIVKYNADNVSVRLEGAEFALSRVSGTALRTISKLGSREEVLAYIDENDAWRGVTEAAEDEAAGASKAVTDANGRICWSDGESSKADGDPEYKISLPMDRLLRLVETKAPPGYKKLEEPIYFYLSTTNEPHDPSETTTGYLAYFADCYEPYQTVIPIGNARAAFVLEKQDGVTGTLLPGARFTLYQDELCAGDGIQAIDHGDGTYYFGDLEMNTTYYLKEEQAPAGYLPDDGTYEIRIDSTGIVSTEPVLGVTADGHYIFTNESSARTLPNTGGSGTACFYAGSIFLTFVALQFIIYRKRKNKDPHMGRLACAAVLVSGLVLLPIAARACNDVIEHQSWPRLNIEAPVEASQWDRITVSYQSSNADSVSWRLLKDGWSVDFEVTDSGVAFTAESEGTYTLIGIARQGDISTRHTVTIPVGSGPDRAGTTESGINRRSIYSWDGKYVLAENENTVSRAMTVLDCDTIYQSIGSSITDEDVLGFLDRRAADGHRVYYLCGKPEWATETDAASMLGELDKVIRWNDLAEGSGRAKFYGIQYDVEKLSSEATMNQVTENYKTVHAVAQEHGIEVEACLPRDLDTNYGFGAQMEDLIANGCDSVAIMNYGTDEGKNIADEVALCRKYGKRIVNITEMQPVGSHGLTSSQTYGDDGIDAVETMWLRLQSYFNYEIGFSYHYLNPILELIQ